MSIRDLFDKDYTDEDIIECLADYSEEVWVSPNLNRHRWYSRQVCVVKFKVTTLSMISILLQVMPVCQTWIWSTL